MSVKFCPRLRFTSLAIAAIGLSACGQQGDPTPAPLPDVNAADVIAIDELPGIGAAPESLSFWIHSTLSFNALLLVANETGLVSYNMEDGVEVARVSDIAPDAIAVSYLGRGASARGLVAALNEDDAAFQLYAVENNTRQFEAVPGDINVGGDIDGFCFGRGVDAQSPQLFIIQNSKITGYDFSVTDAIVTAHLLPEQQSPPNAAGCVIDQSGALIVATNAGSLWLLGDGDPRKLNEAPISAFGAINVVRAQRSNEDGSVADIIERITLVDRGTGVVHLFDSADGHALGAVRIVRRSDAAEDEDAPAVLSAKPLGAFAVTGANLGGIYRNGAAAMVFDSDNGPILRLAPINGIANALSLYVGEAYNPRGSSRTDALPQLPPGLDLGGSFTPPE